jgi:hypothetical protein
MAVSALLHRRDVRLGSFSTDPAGFVSRLMSGLLQKRPWT